jgi:hypothetical protein
MTGLPLLCMLLRSEEARQLQWGPHPNSLGVADSRRTCASCTVCRRFLSSPTGAGCSRSQGRAVVWRTHSRRARGDARTRPRPARGGAPHRSSDPQPRPVVDHPCVKPTRHPASGSACGTGSRTGSVRGHATDHSPRRAVGPGQHIAPLHIAPNEHTERRSNGVAGGAPDVRPGVPPALTDRDRSTVQVASSGCPMNPNAQPERRGASPQSAGRGRSRS